MTSARVLAASDGCSSPFAPTAANTRAEAASRRLLCSAQEAPSARLPVSAAQQPGLTHPPPARTD